MLVKFSKMLAIFFFGKSDDEQVQTCTRQDVGKTWLLVWEKTFVFVSKSETHWFLRQNCKNALGFAIKRVKIYKYKKYIMGTAGT